VQGVQHSWGIETCLRLSLATGAFNDLERRLVSRLSGGEQAVCKTGKRTPCFYPIWHSDRQRILLSRQTPFARSHLLYLLVLEGLVQSAESGNSRYQLLKFQRDLMRLIVRPAPANKLSPSYESQEADSRGGRRSCQPKRQGEAYAYIHFLHTTYASHDRIWFAYVALPNPCP
jgi:hypothetical protein